MLYIKCYEWKANDRNYNLEESGKVVYKMIILVSLAQFVMRANFCIVAKDVQA